MDGYRGNAPAHMAEPASAGSLRALSEHGRFAEFYELGAKLGQGTYSEVGDFRYHRFAGCRVW